MDDYRDGCRMEAEAARLEQERVDDHFKVVE